MVLSGSKRTTYVSSIVNQNSGGGPKKAGLPSQIGREASVSVALRNTSQKLVFLQGPKAMLKQALMIANYYFGKATDIKFNADALVTTNIATADALSNVTVDSTDNDAAITNMITTLDVSTKKATSDTDASNLANDPNNGYLINTAAASLDTYTVAKTAADALQAIIDARVSAATAASNVSTEEGKVSTAQGKVDSYTAAV